MCCVYFNCRTDGYLRSRDMFIMIMVFRNTDMEHVVLIMNISVVNDLMVEAMCIGIIVM